MLSSDFLITLAEPGSRGPRAPRVAIACSGLGRIRRGNETWAETVAEGLHRAHSPVTLLGGGRVQGIQCPYERMASIPREFVLTRGWLSWHHRYLLEQLSATASLLLRRRWRDIDILHVADPDMALQMSKRTKGTGLRVIYKDGLLLGPPFCRHFDYVQVLAPYYLGLAQKQGLDTKNWFVIPHLVNIRRFTPVRDRKAARSRVCQGALNPEAFIVLAVGDFSPASNKRLDWIVEEFSRFARNTPSYLFLAGQAAGAEFTQFERQAKSVLGDQVELFCNLKADEMVSLYQTADAFAHAALREPFGIVFLEAMASGLPVAGHHFPVTEWIMGDGGQAIDMAKPGELAAVLDLWRRDAALRQSIGNRARRRAEAAFSEEEIVPLYQQMYERVAGEPAVQ